MDHVPLQGGCGAQRLSIQSHAAACTACSRRDLLYAFRFRRCDSTSRIWVAFFQDYDTSGPPRIGRMDRDCERTEARQAGAWSNSFDSTRALFTPELRGDNGFTMESKRYSANAGAGSALACVDFAGFVGPLAQLADIRARLLSIFLNNTSPCGAMRVPRTNSGAAVVSFLSTGCRRHPQTHGGRSRMRQRSPGSALASCRPPACHASSGVMVRKRLAAQPHARWLYFGAIIAVGRTVHL